MTTRRQLNDIALRINNELVAYRPDSLSFTDGDGEFTVRTATAGGLEVELITSRDLSTFKGMVKFEFDSTEIAIQRKREYKQRFDNNVIELIGPPGSNFSRTFRSAVLTNDPEVSLSSDGAAPFEFESERAV